MKKLTSAFDGAQYAADEIAQYVHRERPNPEAVRYIDQLAASLARFRKGLRERGLEASYGRDVALVEYPLGELRKFLNDEHGALENSAGAYIFAYFVREQVEALQHLAREIDADNAA
jgi:hypothetical protein